MFVGQLHACLFSSILPNGAYSQETVYRNATLVQVNMPRTATVDLLGSFLGLWKGMIPELYWFRSKKEKGAWGTCYSQGTAPPTTPPTPQIAYFGDLPKQTLRPSSTALSTPVVPKVRIQYPPVGSDPIFGGSQN